MTLSDAIEIQTKMFYHSVLRDGGNVYVKVEPITESLQTLLDANEMIAAYGEKVGVDELTCSSVYFELSDVEIAALYIASRIEGYKCDDDDTIEILGKHEDNVVVCLHEDEINKFPESELLICLPTFTLQDMLNVIPSTIWYNHRDGGDIKLDFFEDACKFIFSLSKEEDKYTALYGCDGACAISSIKFIKKHGKSALEATYNLLCWIAENKLLPKNIKEYRLEGI